MVVKGPVDKFNIDKVMVCTHGDSCRLDSDTTFLFVLTSVSETSFTSFGTSNNTGFTKIMF